MMPIELRGLGKSFGANEVLRGLDLTVAPGQLLGLVGPNGAGKSTLLRTLIGLVPRSRGQVAVLGRDPMREGLLVRQYCCYLPGETGVYLQMTGQQFLDFALGFYPRRHEALQDQLLAGFDLPLAHRVRSYSAGMKQKLALVATLVPDVELYLLDEPDRALDASMRFFLREMLLALKRAGKTIVMSSHHLSEVETLADRLEFLIAGRFVPSQRVAAARERLRRLPRIRLREGRTLPSGARELHREPDGRTVVVETAGDPVQWLRAAPADEFESVELGTARLEDLYKQLIHGGDAGGAP